MHLSNSKFMIIPLIKISFRSPNMLTRQLKMKRPVAWTDKYAVHLESPLDSKRSSQFRLQPFREAAKVATNSYSKILFDIMKIKKKWKFRNQFKKSTWHNINA